MDSGTLLVRTPSEQLTLAGHRTAVVGRARDADVVVNHPRVSRRHLALEPGRDGWLAKDISVNGVFRDGQKVGSVRVGTSPVRLHLGAANGPELVLTALVPAAPPPPRVEPGIDELETRLAPAGAPAGPVAPARGARVARPAPAAAPPAAPAVPAQRRPAPRWARVLPTLLWLFGAAFAIGALVALS